VGPIDVEYQFFEQPILDSPYAYPSRHWELDEDRPPTDQIAECRRQAAYVVAFPESRKQQCSP
jgi:type III restriction enzyme